MVVSTFIHCKSIVEQFSLCNQNQIRISSYFFSPFFFSFSLATFNFCFTFHYFRCCLCYCEYNINNISQACMKRITERSIKRTLSLSPTRKHIHCLIIIKQGSIIHFPLLLAHCFFLLLPQLFLLFLGRLSLVFAKMTCDGNTIIKKKVFHFLFQA